MSSTAPGTRAPFEASDTMPSSVPTVLAGSWATVGAVNAASVQAIALAARPMRGRIARIVRQDIS